MDDVTPILQGLDPKQLRQAAMYALPPISTTLEQLAGRIERGEPLRPETLDLPGWDPTTLKASLQSLLGPQLAPIVKAAEQARADLGRAQQLQSGLRDLTEALNDLPDMPAALSEALTPLQDDLATLDVYWASIDVVIARLQQTLQRLQEVDPADPSAPVLLRQITSQLPELERLHNQLDPGSDWIAQLRDHALRLDGLGDTVGVTYPASARALIATFEAEQSQASAPENTALAVAKWSEAFRAAQHGSSVDTLLLVGLQLALAAFADDDWSTLEQTARYLMVRGDAAHHHEMALTARLQLALCLQIDPERRQEALTHLDEAVAIGRHARRELLARALWERAAFARRFQPAAQALPMTRAALRVARNAPELAWIQGRAALAAAQLTEEVQPEKAAKVVSLLDEAATLSLTARDPETYVAAIASLVDRLEAAGSPQTAELIAASHGAVTQLGPEATQLWRAELDVRHPGKLEGWLNASGPA